VIFTGPADTAEYSSKSTTLSAPRSGPPLNRDTGSSSTIPRESHGPLGMAWKKSGPIGAAQAIPTASTGCSRFLSSFNLPFEVTHASMRQLRLSHEQPVHERAADLRRAFSGIVAGNIKEYGINAIEKYGPFELAGEASIMEPLDRLLRSFVAQRRSEAETAPNTPHATAWSHERSARHHLFDSTCLTVRRRPWNSLSTQSTSRC